MKVLKFGGSVLKNADDIKNIANISYLKAKEDRIVVIVSALFSVTDALLELFQNKINKKDTQDGLWKLKDFHFKIMEDLHIDNDGKKQVSDLFEQLQHVLSTNNDTNKILECLCDEILSFGERISSLIIFNFFKKNNTSVSLIHAEKTIRTNNNYGYAEVNFKESLKLICNCLKDINSQIILCAGFIGSDDNGNITTLGRNGSDYTASLFANALNANSLEIWKDVDGLRTADPKIVKNSKFIKQITYQEMAELSSFGNKILHINAVAPCIEKNIPIFLKNCYNQHNDGTVISNKKCRNFLINGIIRSGAAKVMTINFNEYTNVVDNMIEIQKILKNYTDIVVTVSENIKQRKISLLVLEKRFNSLLSNIKNKLSLNNNDIVISDTKNIITIIGADFSEIVGLSGKIFNILKKNNININALHDDFSSTRISFLCSCKDSCKAINSLHRELIEKS